MPRISQELSRSENAILESNSILEFLEPDLYLTVLDPAVADFKDSARRFLHRADAVLLASDIAGAPDWPEINPGHFVGQTALQIEPPLYVSDDLVEFVRARLTRLAPHPAIA